MNTTQCVLLTLMFFAFVMQGLSAAGRRTNILGETEYNTASAFLLIIGAMILLVTVPWFIWTWHA